MIFKTIQVKSHQSLINIVKAYVKRSSLENYFLFPYQQTKRTISFQTGKLPNFFPYFFTLFQTVGTMSDNNCEQPRSSLTSAALRCPVVKHRVSFKRPIHQSARQVVRTLAPRPSSDYSSCSDMWPIDQDKK